MVESRRPYQLAAACMLSLHGMLLPTCTVKAVPQPSHTRVNLYFCAGLLWQCE